MTDGELERTFRRYLSWRTKNANEAHSGLEIRYIMKTEMCPDGSWRGNVYIEYGGIKSVPLFYSGITFSKISSTLKHYLKEFSGGKSPEEVVLEMESFGWEGER